MQLDYPDYSDLRKSQHSFDQLAVSYWFFLDYAGEGHPERFTAIFASSSLFSLTNLSFVLGRPFTDAEDTHGGPRVVVLSEALWRSRFNGDPNIIGRNPRLSGENFQVVGVCPRQIEDVSTPADDLVYVPVHVLGELQERDDHSYSCFGRLKESVTIDQAQADLGVIQNNLAAQYPETDKIYSIKVIPLQESMVSSYSTTVWLLGGAASCLLFISCANVANLLFARGLARRMEITVRAALGASRRSLVGQLLLETTFLAGLGGLAGVVLAVCLVGLIKAICPDYLYRFSEVRLDTSALLFVLGVTALVSLLSGLLPALSLSKANLGSAIKDQGGRAGTLGRRPQRMQSALVAGQVALACVVLVGAGLLIRSFQMMQSEPLGFNPHHLLTANITPTSTKYSDSPTQFRQLFTAVREKACRLPGVIDAAVNQEQPFEWTFGDLNAPFHVVGQPAVEPGKEPTFCSQNISPEYFKTMQIPLLQGRDFNDSDLADSRHVVIVDAAFAQHFFPGEDPLGKQIEYLWATESDQKVWTIVGVVQNSRHNGPDHGLAPYQAFFPLEQRTNLYRVFLLLRIQNDPLSLSSAVRDIVTQIDPDVPVTRIMTFDDLMSDRSWTRRLGVSLVGVFSGVALLLSAVGLYGVLTYSVSQRRREIGVRIALGAQSTNILKLVIWQGVKLVVIGALIGIASALVLVHFIESILYGVSANDPLTVALTVLVLGFTAILACLFPALGAIRINPLTALRE